MIIKLNLAFKKHHRLALPITALLIIGYILDLYYKYQFTTQGAATSYNAVFRALIFSLIFTLTLKNLKRSKSLMLTSLFFLAISFIAALSGDDGNPAPLLTNTVKALSAFLLISYLSLITSKHGSESIIFLSKLCVTISIVNSTLAYLGAALNIQTFSAYINQPWRAGYNGAIFAQNEAAILITCSLITCTYLARTDNKWLLALFYISGAAAISGSKVLMFSVALTWLIALAHAKKSHAFLVIIPLSLISITYAYYNYDFTSLYELFYDRYEKDGFISMLLSSRDTFIVSKFLAITREWTTIQFAFGGIDVSKMTTEMDFFDSILMYGYVGGSIYMVLYLKKILSPHQGDRAWTVFSVYLFCMAMLGGHFFLSALSAPFIVIASLISKQYAYKPAPQNYPTRTSIPRKHENIRTIRQA